MRLGILMKDADYREALVEKLSTYDNNIFVNILNGSVKDNPGCLIITDVSPLQIDSDVLDAIKSRTVFLTACDDPVPEGCNVIFKFSPVPLIISELSDVYSRWRGNGHAMDCSSSFLAVCCESDSFAQEICQSLARQIIYKRGGRVLILPLSYVNDYGLYGGVKGNTLGRLLYSLQRGRPIDPDSFIYTDSYGLSLLLLKPGRNPVAYLDVDELEILIAGLSRSFDTIIGDIGTCFMNENIKLMKQADRIIYFERGRRPSCLDGILDDRDMEKLITVKLTGETEDASSIDDLIRQIYYLHEDY